MRRLRLTIGGVVAAATMALMPAIAQASTVSHSDQAARPASNTYGTGYARVCNDIQCSKWQVEVSFGVTYNGTNVWINGNPTCTKDGTPKTWCGYGDNGQKTMGIGMNFGNSGQYGLRVYVDGSGDCSVTYDLGYLVYHKCPNQ